jgi:hypothetical protein
MRHLLRRSSRWILLNVAGTAAYLQLASTLWVLPGEEGTPSGAGDAFYWLFVLVPMLVVFLALNSAALFFIVRRVRASGNKVSLATWLAVAAMWVGTVTYDHHRSFRVIDPQYGIEVVLERDA